VTHLRLPKGQGNWAIFLDIDGTLLEIAEHPDLVNPTPRLIELLARLYDVIGGAIALISGRPIADIDKLFGPLQVPVAGLHGLERRDAAGKLHRYNFNDFQITKIKEKLTEFARENSGIFVEDKGPAVALHFRGAPELEARIEDHIRQLTPLLEPDFQVVSGKMVFEIKPLGSNKGTAISAFMQELPFEGRQPVFVGDDVTDEDGFEVVNRLGGHSIGVGITTMTLAQWHLDDVSEVLIWLESLIGNN